MCDQQSLRSACAYAQSDQSLCLSLEYSIIVKLLTGHHLEFLSLKEGCRGSSESTRVKMPHCWKSHPVWLNCVVAVSVLCLFLAVPKVGHAHLLLKIVVNFVAQISIERLHYILRDFKNAPFYILCLFHMINFRYFFSLSFLILLQNGP